MGRSRLIPIVIEIRCPGFNVSPMEWRNKESGKPTTENIGKWVQSFIDSQKLGEPNFGVAQKLCIPTSARVYKQTRDGKVELATWDAPMFMAI
jgi:hypothetical protein